MPRIDNWNEISGLAKLQDKYGILIQFAILHLQLYKLQHFHLLSHFNWDVGRLWWSENGVWPPLAILLLPNPPQSSRLYGHFMLQVSPIKETRAKLFSASNFYCQVISQMPLKNILINNLHKDLLLTFLLGCISEKYIFEMEGEI